MCVCICSFCNIYLFSSRDKRSVLHWDHRRSEMAENKAIITSRLQSVKQNSGKSYGEIAQETGLTNVYVAQLLRRQAQLKPETAQKLQASLPDLTEDLIHEMMKPPMRSYGPNLIQEPCVYRWGLLNFCDFGLLMGSGYFCCLFTPFVGLFLKFSFV